MRAAIYARKSTDEPGKAQEAKSVVQQVAVARAFAEKRGYTVVEEHVYVDDRISGAEFEKRRGLQRLLRALDPVPPFDVLIVEEQKALGRETSETQYLLKKFDMAGVDVVECMHGRSLIPQTWIDKATSSIIAATDEAHRVQSAERVTRAMHRLAKEGRVCGGRRFGYRNVDVTNGTDAHGRPLRAYVEREIVPSEAAVIVRIFELYASGLGLKLIAKKLTAEGAPAPKAANTKEAPVGGWTPSSVRGVLDCDLYRGRVVYGKTKKRNQRWGKIDQKPRPQSEWIVTEREDLRIVSEELWQRVRSRRTDVAKRTLRFADGRMSGRPPKHAAQSLLAGLATCGVCGGSLVVDRKGRKDAGAATYVCLRRRTNGGCKNTLRIPVADMEQAVLFHVEEHVFTPEAIEAVVKMTERDDLREMQAQRSVELRNVEARIKRLVAAVEDGGDVRSFGQRLRELEAQQAALQNEIANLRPLPRLPLPVVQNRLDEWRRMLRQSPTQSRAVLQRVIEGRIVFTPTADGAYEFTATTRFDKLFTGVVVKGLTEPDVHGIEGLEHLTAEDTFDADYSRMLEKAQEMAMQKGWCARRDSNPRPTGSKPAALSS